METTMPNQAETYDTGDWDFGTIAEWDNPQSKQRELPPEGLYTFELVEKGPDKLKDKEYQNEEGTKKDTYFVFKIVEDEDFEGFEFRQYYTLSLNEKSNLRPVVAALMGGKLDPNQRITKADLQGKWMKGMLVHKMSVKSDTIYPKILSPIPYKPRTRSRQTTATQEPKTEDAPF